MSNALCFYPNGNPSLEDDIPCSVGSAVGCCPLNWTCLANGLCYLQNENYYGRYTCTDQSWGPGCPNICTYNDTAKGNEAVLECTTGSYCCDTNRPELSGGTDCCDASPSRFSIDGNAEVPSTSQSQFYPFSAAATSTSAQTSTTANVAAPSLICDNSLGQTFCGSTCCATDQYCAFEGQCSATSVTIESSSSTSTPTFESIASAAGTSSSSSIPTATISTSMATSESASLAAVSSVTSSSVTPSSVTPSSVTSSSVTSSSVTSPSTLSTSKSSTAATTIPTDVTPSSAPSPSITSTSKFKVGVSVAAAAVTLALLLLALCYRRRHRRRRQPEPPISGNASSSHVAPIPPGVAEPPFPNPYNDNFPLSDPGSPTESRSRSKITILPDNHPGDHPPQPYLQHAPALNPYRMSAPAGAAFGDQERPQNISPAPSYSSEDPARRFQTSRSRQTLTGRYSGLQQVLGPESEGA